MYTLSPLLLPTGGVYSLESFGQCVLFTEITTAGAALSGFTASAASQIALKVIVRFLRVFEG